jgi:DNA mismatch endonuclease (patch repair protein)
MAVRRVLHARGLRYRVDVAVPPLLRRRADIVFTKARVAIFLDGCFWHGCPKHGTVPRRNRSWWRAKIAENQRRDRDTARVLTEFGWTVMRFWEHDDPAVAAARIEAVVRKSTGG